MDIGLGGLFYDMVSIALKKIYIFFCERVVGAGGCGRKLGLTVWAVRTYVSTPFFKKQLP